MRLEPGEAHWLPLVAALVDLEGRLVAATPEWAGTGPGTVSYHTGHGHLLVAPDVPAAELDVLMDRLLVELRAAVHVLDGDAGRRATLLAAGLELVAGRPVSAGRRRGVEEVLELAVAGIGARTQNLTVHVAGPLPRLAVPGAGAIALALVQLAVNAQDHEGARRVVLRVDPGPTFAVEWPAAQPAAAPVTTHRHRRRRARWGWGFVQMVADALGGVALPPGPVGPGTRGACVGLGALSLTLPLACVLEGRVERATQAWDQDPHVPALGQPAEGTLARLVTAAAAARGRIAFHDLYRARVHGQRTWAALPPQGGSDRARDLLRGLHHERALWRAPEPYATRVSALATLLGFTLGDPWPSVPPSVYAEALPAACASLGVSLPAAIDVLALPPPRVVALLLAELGGGLVQRGEEVYLAPSAGTRSPLLAALRPGPNGWLRLSP